MFYVRIRRLDIESYKINDKKTNLKMYMFQKQMTDKENNYEL